jgi:hypothetical protein
MAKLLVRSHEDKAHDGRFEFYSERAEGRATRGRGSRKQLECDLEVARRQPRFPRAQVADPEHAVEGRVFGPPRKQRREGAGGPYGAARHEILECLLVSSSAALARE